MTSVSIAMRLTLIAGGRYISILPVTMQHDPVHTPSLRALPIGIADGAGAIAAMTLKGRWLPRPVRLFRDAVRHVAPRMRGVSAVAPLTPPTASPPAPPRRG